MRFINWVLGLGFAVGTAVISAVAVGAVLGFAHPALDFFNHLQPLLFIGTLLCLLLVSMFIYGARWRALVTAVAATGFLASAIIVVPDAVALFSSRAPLPDDGRPVYKLLTHNVWGLNYDAERLAKAVARENPDIITLQEYFPEQRSGLHVMLSVDYPYYSICRGGKRANIAVYSKLRFDAAQDGACVPGTGDRISRIAAAFTGYAGERFTIVTTHLDWPAQVSKLDDGTDMAEGFELAFARQRGQFADLGAALTRLPGPLLIAADFNSTSWSYALSDFADVSGLTRHTHSLLTYPARFYVRGWLDTLPFLPLDHVMTRSGVGVHALYAGDPAGSDHKSVVTEFSINP